MAPQRYFRSSKAHLTEQEQRLEQKRSINLYSLSWDLLDGFKFGHKMTYTGNSVRANAIVLSVQT